MTTVEIKYRGHDPKRDALLNTLAEHLGGTAGDSGYSFVTDERDITFSFRTSAAAASFQNAARQLEAE